MADRNNEQPYYRTVPSSPESDEDEVFLPGEDDVIEMSPQIPSEESTPEISGKAAKSPVSQAKEKDKNDEEEALLRQRLLEKKREKEMQVGKQREKTLPTTDTDQKQSEKQKQYQASTITSSSSQITQPKRERIVWNRGDERKREEKRTESTSTTKLERHKSTLKESEQRKREKSPASAPLAPSTSGNKHQERKNLVGTSSSLSRMDDKQEKVKASLSDRHHHQHRPHRDDHHERAERHRDQQRCDKLQNREEQQREIMTTKKRSRKNVSNSSTEDAPSMEENARKKTPRQEVSRPLETTHVDVSPPIDEAVESLAMDEQQQQQPPIAETANKKAKRYSKFESSPEPSGDEEENIKGTGLTKAEELRYSGDEEERKYRDQQYKEQQRIDDFIMEQQKGAQLYESDEEEVYTEETRMDMDVDENLPENKEFDELTEEEKAMISPDKLKQMEERYQKRLIARLPVYYPGISGCRSVREYECLNKISEGTFGVVYRAQERRTDEIVALKKLKMEKEKQGFPITSLREINMLLKCGTHPNVLNVREVVVGSNLDKIFMVMEYLEHDLKSLMDLMKKREKKWTIPQVKTLLHQLLSGVAHMHEEYVIHRDLKTSNLLLSHRGILKIADFGLAREFGDPLKPYTPVVVTLWYRSPELLLGTRLYSTAVDIWSVGCILGEFFKLKPLFAGQSEPEQLKAIFKEVGTPNEQVWPGCMELPGMKNAVFPDTPFNQLRRKFASELPDDDGFDLFNGLLRLDPKRRLSAQEAMKSKWFHNDPKPTPPSSFPTWPAKSEHNKKPPEEPAAPRKPTAQAPTGFTLKFDVPKF